MFKHVVAPNRFQRCGGRTALRRHLLGDSHGTPVVVPAKNKVTNAVTRRVLTASIQDSQKEKK